MKRIYLAFILLMPYSVFGQSTTDFAGTTKPAFTLGMLMGTNEDFNVLNDSHITGTPFYYEQFLPCDITLLNGEVYKGLQMRLNLETNSIHYKTSDTTELVAGKGVVRSITFFHTEKKMLDSTTFSCGYLGTLGNDENTYYEEMASGTTKLLRQAIKFLSAIQSLTATPLDKQYNTDYNYYVCMNYRANIERWRKGKEFMLEVLHDKKEEIVKFIDQKGLKCKSPEDARKIIDYYNTLK